jgi:hypothetical protein
MDLFEPVVGIRLFLMPKQKWHIVTETIRKCCAERISFLNLHPEAHTLPQHVIKWVLKAVSKAVEERWLCEFAQSFW